MISPKEKQRISRQLVLPGFGLAAQERLAGAHVVVIGAGGLGGPLLLSLAGAGVGKVTIVDDDEVSLSNISRQILFNVGDIGESKARLAAEKLSKMHPDGSFLAVTENFSPENALKLVSDADLLVEASDNFNTKFLSADVAEVTSTPLVWGSVLRFEGQVGLCWSGERVVDGVGFRDLHPEQPSSDLIPDNAKVGVLGASTGVIGNLMATEVIKFIVGVGDSRPGLLLSYDAMSARLIRSQVVANSSRRQLRKLG